MPQGDGFSTLSGTGGSTRVRTNRLQVDLAQAARNRRNSRTADLGAQGINKEDPFLTGGQIKGGFFGLPTTNPTGNDQVVRDQGGGAPLSAGDIASRFGSTVNQDISSEQQGQLDQFFNPSVTSGQEQFLRRAGTQASGQGLMGGAVRGQLQDQAQRFVGQNRAQSFGAVSGLIQSGFSSLRDQTNPFFQGGGGRSALEALQAFGLGGDALFGLSQSAGVNVSLGAGGTTGNDRVAQAFSQFVNPQASDVAGFVQGNVAGAGRRATDFASQRGNFKLAAQEGGRKVLQEELAGQFQGINEGIAEFESLAGAANVFNTGANLGDLSASRQLANFDTSKLSPLLQQLGVNRPGASGNAPKASQFGRGFLPNSDLFKTITGIGI